jgi:hypothetical protein
LENIEGIYGFASGQGISEIHLLPYNIAAPGKYEWVSRTFTPGRLEPRGAKYYQGMVASAPPGINVILI